MKINGKRKINYKSYVISKIINGILFSLPLIIIIMLFTFLFKLIVNILSPVSRALTETVQLNVWVLNLIAFALLIILFLMIGIFTSTRKGKYLFTNVEKNIFSSIPLYNTIKNITKQFTSVEERPFEEVVLIDVYGTKSHMVGFVVEHMDNGFCIVYVPTAPNPTNGFVYHVLKKDLITISTTTEKAMATVIGMGAGSKKIFKGDDYSNFVESTKDNYYDFIKKPDKNQQ